MIKVGKEEHLVYVSLLMQIVNECRPNLDRLSPDCKRFVIDMLKEGLVENDEISMRLYFYANEVLDKKENLH